MIHKHNFNFRENWVRKYKEHDLVDECECGCSRVSIFAKCLYLTKGGTIKFLTTYKPLEKEEYLDPRKWHEDEDFVGGK